MYCKNCGIEINVNDKFCSECGAKVSQENSQRPEMNNSEIIKKIDCEKSGIIKMITMIFLGIFFAVNAVIYMDSGDSTIELIGKILLVFAIIYVVISPIYHMNYRKRFCLIKKDGISGVTCGTTDLTNTSFEFLYSEVISVKKNKAANLVVVQTANKKIDIFLPYKEINFVYEHINGQITE